METPNVDNLINATQLLSFLELQCTYARMSQQLVVSGN